mmetsp:Transcript_35/g.47  ORF Transcript_35/g.47 Transcript_35/m.47 type:complete len:220 (+) Transcript_35:61-720(+)
MVAAPLRGISKAGRSKTYHNRGLWAIKKKNGGKFPVHKAAAKKAEAPTKAPKFSPADDVPVPKKKLSVTNKTAKLRSSITPGTVLIVLSGRFRGKRVVFLKQLESGLLLVTGPFKVNGVPLRRVNQTFCIATSAKVDVSKVDVAKFDDGYFKKPVTEKKKGEFVEGEAEKEPLSQEKIADQKKVDDAILSKVKAVPELEGYLSARFSLKAGDCPHRMKF